VSATHTRADTLPRSRVVCVSICLPSIVVAAFTSTHVDFNWYDLSWTG
jgi:hypothetical protein